MKKKSFYLPSLDGLRFLAFIMVFVSHIPALPSSCHPGIVHLMALIQRVGWMGVDLFLCLSAYLIFRLLEEEFALTGSISIKNFWMRRILRIWPLYFFSLMAGLMILPFWNQFLSFSDPAYKKVIEIHLIPHLLFLGNWSTALFYYVPTPLSPLWTVSLEEQFYVLLPFIFLFSVKSPRRCLVFLAAGFLGSALFRAFSIGIDLKYPFIWTSTLTRLEPFIMGILVAFCWEFFQKNWLSKWGLLIVIGLVAALMFSPLITTNSFHSVWQLCSSALIASLMLILSLTNSTIKKILTFSFFRQGGKISYGLYVFHAFCLNVIFSNLKVVSFGDWIRNVILSFAFVFVLSMFSYYFFERLILKYKSRYSCVKSGAI